MRNVGFGLILAACLAPGAARAQVLLPSGGVQMLQRMDAFPVPTPRQLGSPSRDRTRRPDASRQRLDPGGGRDVFRARPWTYVPYPDRGWRGGYRGNGGWGFYGWYDQGPDPGDAPGPVPVPATVDTGRRADAVGSPEPAPVPAAPPTPGPPRTFYVIPGCYAGDTPPRTEQLPGGCDVGGLRERPPVLFTPAPRR